MAGMSFNMNATTPSASSTLHIVYTNPQPFCPGPDPAIVFCPFCRKTILTRIKRKVGMNSWLSSCMCIIFGCIFGCCLIPCFWGECKDVEHYCSLCGVFLGRFRHGRD